MLERKYRKNNITYDERLNIINILTKKKKTSYAYSSWR